MKFEDSVFEKRNFVKRGQGFWVHIKTHCVAFNPYYNTDSIKLEIIGGSVSCKHLMELDAVLTLISNGMEAKELDKYIKGVTIS